MKGPPEWIKSLAIFVSGAPLLIWPVSPLSIFAFAAEGMPRIHLNVCLCAVFWSFLQGWILAPKRYIQIACAWCAAGLAFLFLSPRQVDWFDHGFWGNDCPGAYFGLAPWTLWYAHPHTLIFFLLFVPALAAWGAMHGSRFRMDGNGLRIVWVTGVTLALILLFVGEESIYKQLPYWAQWCFMRLPL